MDKDTRNAIEKATQRARQLLDDDFTSQLEGTFDVIRSGKIAANPGAHLSARQVFEREKIVAAIEHKCAAGMKPADAVEDYVRDAAFTTLNRFVALKMLEARGLVQECVTKGEQSSGYREFCGLAPGVALLPDGAGHRLYIESLFDELSTEVKVLFDRRDAASVLWPRRQTFESLLDVLNALELAAVWGEDETIGWVYQFFNSKEERQAMRDPKQGGSQVPRNSRELAVRNQFFTPRYVVQFLTDNTLGRIWYEMRKGVTHLVDICEYMVRSPNESYELRAKKDPRDLRILDPACGSGHFLLYAFDLLLAIYEEAWANSGSSKTEATGKRLCDDYPDLDILRRALPELILRHNLYGVDIDPRCAQIAQLALWMRAQRAFRDFSIARAERPLIRRANIIVAEPMPGERDLQSQFAAGLGDHALAEQFLRLVERMKYAGDLGLLIRAEEFMERRDKTAGTADLFTPSAERLRIALECFAAGAAAKQQARRRLFRDDAAHGLGLVEIGVMDFDTVVMNPPFGSFTDAGRSFVESAYPDSRYDIGAVFIEECSRRLAPRGRLGVIFNRTNWFLSRLGRFRSRQVQSNWLPCNVDLGLGVLDAFVETALTVVANEPPLDRGHWIRLVDVPDKKGALRDAVATVRNNEASERDFKRDQGAFAAIDGSPYSYWVPDPLLEARRQAGLTALGFEAKQGLATKDNFRFLRLHWEVPSAHGERWKLYSKGGAYAPLCGTYHLVVDWGSAAHAAYDNRDGQFCCLLTGQSARYAFRPAVTYSQRTSKFSARIFPENGLFDTKGSVVFAPTVRDASDPEDDLVALCLLLNTDLAQFFFDSSAGASDEGKARDYSQSMVGSLPAPPGTLDAMRPLVREAREIFAGIVEMQTFDPTSIYFKGLPPTGWWQTDRVQRLALRGAELQDRLARLLAQATRCYANAISLDSETQAFVETSVRATHRQARHDAIDLSREKVALLLRQAMLVEVLGGKPTVEHIRAVDESSIRLLRALPWGGLSTTTSRSQILVDDSGHQKDLASAFISKCEELGLGEVEAHAVLSIEDIREWCKTPAFVEHLTLFSRSQRIAPVVWQLAVPSSQYSVWIYLHGINADTLYTIQNEYVGPKLAHEEQKLERLRSELGSSTTATNRKLLVSQESIVEEIRAFLEEIRRVAPLWGPDPDDGAMINCAPLWRLLPHNKTWQRDVKATWDALCKGDYDWTHLAMRLWPERVVPRCASDRSLAVAHRLEEVFWVEDSKRKWKPRPQPTSLIEVLVRERTSSAVKAALKNILEAPGSPPNGGHARGGVRTEAAAEER